MKKLHRGILGAALASLALVAPMAGANAASPVLENVAQEQVIGTSANIAQLPSDIDEPAFIPDSIVVLDHETGEVVAELDPAAMDKLRIRQLGPGCSTDSLCLYRSNSNVGFGFLGAGTMSGSWSSVNKYGSKKYANQIWWNSGGKVITGGKRAAGTLVALTGNVTVNKVKIF